MGALPGAAALLDAAELLAAALWGASGRPGSWPPEAWATMRGEIAARARLQRAAGPAAVGEPAGASAAALMFVLAPRSIKAHGRWRQGFSRPLREFSVALRPLGAVAHLSLALPDLTVRSGAENWGAGRPHVRPADE